MENEKRLIDANTIPYEEHYVPDPDSDKQWDYKKELCVLKPIIDQMPTVDAVEVVHGRWMWDVETHGDHMYGVDEDFGYRCSRCKVWADEYGVDGDIYEEPPTHILHYCPNCGAKMDKE